MKTRRHAVAFLTGLMLAVVLTPAAPLWADLPKDSVPPSTTSQRVTATMMGMPLQFEANHGQVDAHVTFLARGNGYTLFLTPTESVMVLQQRESATKKDPRAMTNPTALPKQAPINQAVVRMKLEEANPSPAIDGMEQLPGMVNYFIGNDPAKWYTDVPTYAKVQYQNPYPGIALAYYGNQGRLEYDFIVAPGADPNQIKLAFEGASEITVADSGDLLLTTALGDVRMQKPVVYQLESDGHKTLVAGHYAVASPSVSLQASRTTRYAVGFELASYDHAKPVVIDPVLLYSTYLGGSNEDRGQGIAVDAAGQAYVTGYTSSTNFPTANPLQATNAGNYDVFVTKLSAAGTSLLYSTYLGSSGDDVGFGIVVDATGTTFSTNFPTVDPVKATLGGDRDVFVTKLSAAGSSLLYSTYLGGSGGDEGYGIAVDAAGHAYVTGNTQSTNFPTVNPVQATFGGSGGQLGDAFVTKLSAAGSSLLYSTYLGGSIDERGNKIVVDAAGQAYVTGQTSSTNFPTANPFQATNGGGGGYDAFVTKLSAAGSSLLYSTYLGGSHYDFGDGIAVDAAGQAFVAGHTGSPNFPTANPLQATNRGGAGNYDVFVTKLSAAGTSLLYSTYLGGSADEWSQSIAVDAAGQAFVTGHTYSTDFPTANPLQATNVGGANAFVTKLNAAGSHLLYSTYLGGSGGDQGNGIAVDAAGSAYVTGETHSTDFPTANPFQATYGGNYDAFVTKLSAAGSSLLYSTYLGGSSYDQSFGIAVDTAGQAYVTGWTASTNFPTVSPVQATNGGSGGSTDAFVTKLSVAGSSLLYSTYLGGNNYDEGYGIAVDAAGQAYVTGHTTSTNFPTANPVQATNGGSDDAFVMKLSPAGSSLLYSTYLGGNSTEQGFGIAVDAAGSAYVTGQTLSTNFLTANPVQATNGGSSDAFVAKITTNVPFAVFRANAEIELRHQSHDENVEARHRPHEDAFEMTATFTLGPNNNGIAPLTEAVTVQVGTFSFTIPAGSFTLRKGRFTFEGVINGVKLEAVLRPLILGNDYECNVEGKGADLTGTVNPVTVGLTIGDDSGSTTVTAKH